MIGRLLLLAGACLAFWVLASLAARILMDDRDEAARQGVYCGTCILLCVVPTSLTLWWGRRALAASPEQQLAAVMGGTGIRMFAVLLAGWALASSVGYYGDSSFWNWLLAAYLFTLALEITLLLVGRPARRAQNLTEPIGVMAHDPKSHVMDAPGFEFFDRFFGDEVVLHLPKIGDFQITKFMILELIAAGLILLIYIPLSRRVRAGALPTGRWWNAWESLLTFVRNEIAKPNLDPPPGHHDEGHGHDAHGHEHHGEKEHAHHHEEKPASGLSEADKYVPYLWTVFLFVLFCNLLGMFPYMGSPTANIFVTGALALCSFIMFHAAAMFKMGPLKYFAAQWPKIEIELPVIGKGMAFVFSLLLFVIEMFGTIIKAGVLAIRLFANMFAGHMVLATILLFIVTVGEATRQFTPIWATVTVASVLGVIALSLLELFVAFLQAFVFTFLTALFMGMALHPQH